MNLTEVVGQPPAADLLGFLSQLQGMLGNLITRNIGGHDKNGVFTFDGLPLTVCEATLTQFMNIKRFYHEWMELHGGGLFVLWSPLRV